MSFIKRLSTVTPVTDASGDATAYSEVFTGKIVSITYTLVDYAAGVDFTITLESTGETVWTESNVNATKTCAPRLATHSTAGVAALYAAGGSAVLDKIAAADDRIKIVIAQGGNAKSGTFKILVE